MLDLLRERDVEFDVVEYLKSPLERATLERFLDWLPNPPADLIRRDRFFDSLELEPADYETRSSVVELILEYPELMQRPIVIRGERAVIARPSERVLDLL